MLKPNSQLSHLIKPPKLHSCSLSTKTVSNIDCIHWVGFNSSSLKTDLYSPATNRTGFNTEMTIRTLTDTLEEEYYLEFNVSFLLFSFPT